MKEQKHYLSLHTKIWFTLILIFTPVFVSSYIWFYLYTNEKILNSISYDLLQTIERAAEGIDIDSFTKLYEEESSKNPMCPPRSGDKTGYYPENPLYWEHVTWLATIGAQEPEARLYTYIKGERDGEIIAIGSSGALSSPPAGLKFCEHYTSTTTRIYEGLTRRVDVRDPYEDSFGEWITTYMPLHDKNGTIVGAIGVDILASYVRDVQSKIIKNGLTTFIVLYAIIFVFSYYISKRLTRSLDGKTER